MSKQLSPLMNALAELSALEARGHDLTDPELLHVATRRVVKETAIAVDRLTDTVQSAQVPQAVVFQAPPLTHESLGIQGNVVRNLSGSIEVSRAVPDAYAMGDIPGTADCDPAAGAETNPAAGAEARN